MEKSNPENKDYKKLELLEWEELMRHPYFERVTDVLSQRVDSIQNNVRNRAKRGMDLNSSVETAGDLRAMAELEKILALFESLKIQILQNKGVET